MWAPAETWTGATLELGLSVMIPNVCERDVCHCY